MRLVAARIRAPLLHACVAADTYRDDAFTYTGEQTDASTALEYLRARYGACLERSRRDSATGRFLSLDPMGDGYDYAYDNPAATAAPLTFPASRNFRLPKT